MALTRRDYWKPQVTSWETSQDVKIVEGMETSHKGYVFEPWSPPSTDFLRMNTSWWLQPRMFSGPKQVVHGVRGGHGNGCHVGQGLEREGGKIGPSFRRRWKCGILGEISQCFEHWNWLKPLQKFEGQTKHACGQNQLSGTQLVTTGLMHVDKWIYWYSAKWNLGRFIFWVRTKLTGRKSLIHHYSRVVCSTSRILET